MRHFYKDSGGQVFEYESAQDAADFGPSDLVAMTEEEVNAHLTTAPLPTNRERIEAERLRAYANPVTGSDRHFAEANRLQIMGAPKAEIDAAKAAGVARYAEIQEQYPWP